MNHNNASSVLPGPVITQPLSYTIILSVLYVVIFIMSAVGNSLVVMCYALDSRQRMRTPMNLLIVNLAISDLCVTLITMPINYSRNITYRTWVIGKVLCHIFHGLPNAFVAASGFTATAISVERYRYICRPHQPKISHRAIILTVIIIWIAAFLTALPIIATIVYSEGNGTQSCNHVFHRDIKLRIIFDRIYIVSLIVVVFVLPLCIISLLYWRVGRFLKERQRNCQSGNSMAFNQANKKVFKMLLTIVSLMFICWIPLYSCFLIITFAPVLVVRDYNSFRIIYSFSHLFSYVNGAINPIVYAKSHDIFKKAFKRTIRRDFSLSIRPSISKSSNLALKKFRTYNETCYNVKVSPYDSQID